MSVIDIPNQLLTKAPDALSEAVQVFVDTLPSHLSHLQKDCKSQHLLEQRKLEVGLSACLLICEEEDVPPSVWRLTGYLDSLDVLIGKCKSYRQQVRFSWTSPFMPVQASEYLPAPFPVHKPSRSHLHTLTPLAK
jgi:hypothetical protein